MSMFNATSIADLNDECLLHVFKYLSIIDRLSLDLVCKRWKTLCSLLWRKVHTFDVCNEQLEYIDPELYQEDDIDVSTCKKAFEKCIPYLKKVNLSRIENFKTTTLMDLWHYCTVQFGHQRGSWPKGTLNCLKKSLLQCEKLEELWLCRCVINVNDNFLIDLFAKNRNLRKVVLTEYELTGECFSQLPVEVLETLILFDCTIQCPQYLSSTVSLASKLRILSVSGNGMELQTSRMMASPVSSRNLMGSNEAGQDPRGLLYYICKLKNLTILSLRNSGLDGNMLRIISTNCSNLKVLDIEYCEKVENTSLRYTKSMPNLKCLDIGFIDELSDTALQVINENLQVLRMSSTKFSEGALLTLLFKMKNLEELDISSCKQFKNSFIESAIDIVKLRRERIPLEIGLYDTEVDIETIRNVCSLVKLNFSYIADYERFC